MNRPILRGRRRDLLDSRVVAVGLALVVAIAQLIAPARGPEPPRPTEPAGYHTGVNQAPTTGLWILQRWADALLMGRVTYDVIKLTQGEDKNLLVYGSGQLTETLREAGLIGEYRLLI